VSYTRVSTGKQGRSDLGIEAQCDAIARFAAAEGCEIVVEFVEVETGKGAALMVVSDSPGRPAPYSPRAASGLTRRSAAGGRRTAAKLPVGHPRFPRPQPAVYERHEVLPIQIDRRWLGEGHLHRPRWKEVAGRLGAMGALRGR
jgi:hypothetical protein